MDPYKVVPRVRIKQRRTDGLYINAFMADNKQQQSIENIKTIYH